MKRLLWQVSDCSPKAKIVEALEKEEIILSSLRIYNGSGWAAVVTVYVSGSAATSDTTNIVYYNAALANNWVVELTWLSLWGGQKLEVLTDVAANLIVSAFWEKNSCY